MKMNSELKLEFHWPNEPLMYCKPCRLPVPMVGSRIVSSDAEILTDKKPPIVGDNCEAGVKCSSYFLKW